MSACDGCLRRGALLALLAPRIQREKERGRNLVRVLALPEGELVKALCKGGGGTVTHRLARFDPAVARSRAAALGIEVVCRHAAAYPAALAQAVDAPAALYLLGEPGLLQRAAADGAVAIVGSRRASPYGLEMARALGRDLAAGGVVVVSGMAYGIDSAAHQGALSAGGPTIAVLPGGADVPYPAGKRDLYEEIKGRGLAVAEMPPGMRPFRWSFPARNRIMAALARMTVVVEGTEGSGSLITAAFAEDLGRDVGAVPGQATSPLAAGPNRLLSEGAAVVRSADDVLDALYGPGHRRTAPGASPRPAFAAGLEPRLRRLLEAVESGIGTPEVLAGQAHVAEVLAGLSELELLGLVRRGPGGDYVRRV